MLEDNLTEFIDDLTYQVKSNNIPMSRIDDAVRRILRVKFTMGLFENPFADLSLLNQLGSQVYHLLIVNLPATVYCPCNSTITEAYFFWKESSGIGQGSSEKITSASEKW